MGGTFTYRCVWLGRCGCIYFWHDLGNFSVFGGDLVGLRHGVHWLQQRVSVQPQCVLFVWQRCRQYWS